jgi:1-acyl-sn-glycerol-3-phosphate acyltransferase
MPVSVSLPGNKIPKRNSKILPFIGNSVLKAFGWQTEGELPDLPKFVVVGAPHTSNWDFVYAMAFIFSADLKIFWMGKHTLFKSPYGGFMRKLGGIAIDRRASRGTVEQMVDVFNQQEKLVLLIPPEGTRKKVESWKTGFYHIAQGANVPILLAYLDYQRKVVGFGPTITPSGDITADVTRIQDFYRDIPGKYPH